MEKKKLTTAEILALARKQGAPGSGPADSPASSESAPSESASSESAPEPARPDAPQPEAASPPAAGNTPKTTPKTTAEILAAARAQGGSAPQGDAGSTSRPAATPAAPKSTADILAAARAQGGGGGTSAKPKSTADILAAARAQGKGGASAAKPAAAQAKPATTKARPATPAGERPSVQEMLAAVRKGEPAAATGKAGKPKLPGSPKPAARGTGQPIHRRSFFAAAGDLLLVPFNLAWLLMGAIGAIWSLAAARFMMPNMVVELPSRFKVGPPSDFPMGTVSEKYKASRGIWIVHTDQYNGQNLIYALTAVCTHLGCTPNWLQAEQKFKCPCHGSGFYITGINFEGPAPRPLERVGIRLASDGMLEVDKSLKFQEELGQWADPASFYEPV